MIILKQLSFLFGYLTIGNKILLNYFICYINEVDSEENVIKTRSNEFACPCHEEADTKIVFHATNIDYAANITIGCSNMDILIIMLGNMHHRKSQSNSCIECGVSNMIHNSRYTTVFIKMLIYVLDEESDIEYTSDEDVDDQSDCE